MKKRIYYKTTGNFRKPLFDENLFAHQVIHEIGMSKASPAILDRLTLEIKRTLLERINATVFFHFSERELILIRNIMESHPDLDITEAVSLVAVQVEGLDDLIVKTVDDLFDELVEKSKIINSEQ